MFGLKYISHQVYTFEDYEQLQQALQYNQIGNYEIDQSNKIIKYQIDRSQCIRLNDLFYWIQNKVIKFCYGQFLDLIENLLTFVQTMQQLNIKHDKLDENRIWLILQPKSEYPQPNNFKFIYRIAFTGFQCPFYEKDIDSNLQLSDKIHSIFFYFIETLQKNKIVLSKVIEYEQANKEIYKPLYNKFYESKVQNTINFVQQLKSKLKYDVVLQKTQYDDLDNSSKSNDSLKMKRNLNKIIQFYQERENDSLMLESFLMTILPELNKSDNLENEIVKNYYIQQSNLLTGIQQQISEQSKKEIKSCLGQLITNSQQYYKFTFTDQEILEQEEEILKALESNGIYKYFHNSWLIQLEKDLKQKINNAQIPFINNLVNERFRLSINQKNLQLSSALI